MVLPPHVPHLICRMNRWTHHTLAWHLAIIGHYLALAPSLDNQRIIQPNVSKHMGMGHSTKRTHGEDQHSCIASKWMSIPIKNAILYIFFGIDRWISIAICPSKACCGSRVASDTRSAVSSRLLGARFWGASPGCRGKIISYLALVRAIWGKQTIVFLV